MEEKIKELLKKAKKDDSDIIARLDETTIEFKSKIKKILNSD